MYVLQTWRWYDVQWTPLVSYALCTNIFTHENMAEIPVISKCPLFFFLFWFTGFFWILDASNCRRGNIHFSDYLYPEIFVRTMDHISQVDILYYDKSFIGHDFFTYAFADKLCSWSSKLKRPISSWLRHRITDYSSFSRRILFLHE